MSLLPLVFFLFLLGTGRAQEYLTRSGTELRLNGEKVFMSGMNIAWERYGMDFGDGRYDCCTGAALEDYLERIAQNGGNSVRIWLHCDGRMTPDFDSNGYVVGTDSWNTMISDLDRYLTKASEVNILVFLVLWNGATELGQQYKELLWDDSKLQSYIDNALRPMVRALSHHRSLGGWEIMNEPEGIVLNDDWNANDCFDTTVLSGSGAGWANEYVPMENLLRFINWQIAAVKEEDGKALATVGSWSELAQTDSFPNTNNFYKDRCLQEAGGYSYGTIDIQQMHTYENGGSFNQNSPLNIHNSYYNLDKPNIIGEFSEDGGDGRDITLYMNHAYYEDYSGAWTWQANGGGMHSDDFDTQARATRHLQGRNDQGNGGQVDIDIQ